MEKGEKMSKTRNKVDRFHSKYQHEDERKSIPLHKAGHSNHQIKKMVTVQDINSLDDLAEEDGTFIKNYRHL